MSTRFWWLRRLAHRVATHAAATLPPTRRVWADAMRREIEHIPGDISAFCWAVGCLLACYAERNVATRLLRMPAIRRMLALVIVGHAATFLFATVLTLAYLAQASTLTQFLGNLTPGDDYRRFVPLMNATPWWLHGLWITASALFVLAAWDLVHNRGRAFIAFAFALGCGTLGNLVSFGMPEYRVAFSFPEPNVTRDYVLPGATMVTFVVLAVSLWAHSRWCVSVPDPAGAATPLE